MEKSTAYLPTFTLQQILTLRNASFIEPHAWAVAYQALAHFLDLFRGRTTMEFVSCDLSSFILSSSGQVLSKTVVQNQNSTGKIIGNQRVIEIGLDGFLEALGNQLYDALCLHVSANRKSTRSTTAPHISPALDNLLSTLRFQRFDEETDSDTNASGSDDDSRVEPQGRDVFSKPKQHRIDCIHLMQICELRFAGCQFEMRLDDRGVPGALCSLKCNGVREHYVTVCRTLYAEALEQLRVDSATSTTSSDSAYAGTEKHQAGGMDVRVATGNVAQRTKVQPLMHTQQRRAFKPSAAIAKSVLEDSEDEINANLNDELEEETNSEASSDAFTSVSQLQNSAAGHSRSFAFTSQRTTSEVGYSLDRSMVLSRQRTEPQIESKVRGSTHSTIEQHTNVTRAGVPAPEQPFSRNTPLRHSFAAPTRLSATQNALLNACSRQSTVEVEPLDTPGNSQSGQFALIVRDRRTAPNQPRISCDTEREIPFNDENSMVTTVTLSTSLSTQRRRIVPVPSDMAALRDDLTVSENAAAKIFHSTEQKQLPTGDSDMYARQAVRLLSGAGNNSIRSAINSQPSSSTATSTANRLPAAQARSRTMANQSNSQVKVDAVEFNSPTKGKATEETTTPALAPTLSPVSLQQPTSSPERSQPGNSSTSVGKLLNAVVGDMNKVVQRNRPQNIERTAQRRTVGTASLSARSGSTSAAASGKANEGESISPSPPSPSTRPEIHSRLCSTASSCLELTLEEIAYTQSVACEAELETLAINRELHAAVASGAVCFNCLKTRFGHLFDRGVTCRVCSQRVCDRCSATLRVPDTPDLFALPIVFLLESSIVQRLNPFSVGTNALRSMRNMQLFELNSVRPATQIHVCQTCHCVIIENVQKCGMALFKLLGKSVEI